jgi:hypothetical protein
VKEEGLRLLPDRSPFFFIYMLCVVTAPA